MPKLWIINQFANTPDLPGHTRQYEIAISLSKKNWQIKVFSSDFNLSKRKYCKLTKFQLKKIERIENIKWIWLRVFPYHKNNWKRYINLLSFCIILIFIISFNLTENLKKKNLPDVILASSPQLPSAFLMLILSKLFKIPFVAEIRDLWPQVLIDQGGLSPNNFIVKCFSWMEKQIYKNANYVVVLAKGSRKYVQKRGAKKIIWLPNGPDLNNFKFNELPPFEEFSFKRRFKIIYTGAHGEANDLINIVEAAKLLADIPVKFILIGDGPSKSNLILKARSLNNIEFRDSIPKEKIPFTLAEADAVILTLKKVPLFKYGVSPNKLYDAYAIGRPIITAVDGNINNEIEVNRLGFTAESSNPRKLSLAIRKLFNTSRNERIAMAKRARKLAEDVYSRQRVNLAYEKLLKEIMINKEINFHE